MRNGQRHNPHSLRLRLRLRLRHEAKNYRESIILSISIQATIYFFGILKDATRDIFHFREAFVL